MRKLLTTVGLIALLLIFTVGTVGAQSGVDPSATPTTVPTSEPAEPTVYTHPIVQILSAYFGRLSRPMLPTATPTATEVSTDTPTDDPSVADTEVPSETPTVTETPTEEPVAGPEEFAEEIAAYHADGMGFGVLVKFYAMAEAAVQACVDKQPAETAAVVSTGDPTETTEPTCEAVAVQNLVDEFQGGTGMGQLFKEYGKPALLGVGQVKKALKRLPSVTATPAPTGEVTVTPAPSQDGSTIQNQTTNQKSNNGKGQSNKPMKVKTPKPPKGPNK